MEDSLQAHQYYADANEAESWMKEKEPIVSNTDYGKDEDSSEALLKKHEALMSDLTAFGNTIEGLKEQARNCRVSIINKFHFSLFCISTLGNFITLLYLLYLYVKNLLNYIFTYL